MDLSEPQVMGILNVTPDSFYAASRKQTEQEIAECASWRQLDCGRRRDDYRRRCLFHPSWIPGDIRGGGDGTAALRIGHRP